MHNQSKSGILPSGLLICLTLAGMATLLRSAPEICWWWCWISSVVLLAGSLTGKIFYLPTDLPLREQTLRPWLLINLIFVSYGFLTSIFFWLDLNGYRFWNLDQMRIATHYEFDRAASAQYCYLIGHIGFVIGLGSFIRWSPRTAWRIKLNLSLPTLVLYLAAIAGLAVICFQFVPALSQLEIKAKGVLTVAAGISSGLAFRTDRRLLPVALTINIVLMLFALSSGWKEEVLVLVILNAIAFYPVFPKSTVALVVAVFFLGFIVLPPIANEVRNTTWKGETTRWEGLQQGMDRIQSKTWDNLIDESWSFFTGRLSEAVLFVRYLDSVPSQRPFYGTRILEQAAITPVPRVFWPQKENTEELVHQRVVENGVVSSESNVSAKPQYVVDGYLSAGTFGVFFALLVYGALAQILSATAEHYLGGYLLGGVLFNGLFSFLWRGACFEFYVNAFVWSSILVVVIHMVGKSMGLLRLQR